MRLLTVADIRAYQRRAINFGMNVLCCALFLDMGLGKTIAVLTIIRKLLVRRQVKRVLIVGPIRVIHGVWRQEARKWVHTRTLRFSLVHGTEKKRVEALNTPAHIYLINYENLQWLVDTYARLKYWPFDMLVLDESDAIKDPSTNRFKAIKKPLSLIKRRIIMTGTPAPQALYNLWSQIYVLDQGQRYGTEYGRFKQRYFYIEHDGYTLAPRDGAEVALRKLIRDISLRLDRNDWLDLPGVLAPNDIVIPFTKSLREQYRKLEREMFLKLDEKTHAEAVNAAVLTGKCQQFANGALIVTHINDYEEETKDWRPIHKLKLEALQAVVDQTETPVAVAYYFKTDLIRLREIYPHAPALGAGSGKDTERIINEWKAGKHKVLLIHPGSASHGIDGLQYGGHTIVFFSLMWSAGRYAQLIARFDRNGQTKPVVIHRLVCERTVDEVAIASITAKADSQGAFLRALKDYRTRITRDPVTNDIDDI